MIDFNSLAAPLLGRLDPERAHGLTIRALRYGLVPRPPVPSPSELAQTLFGLDFANPVGLAAGADKNAEVPRQMLGLGFGFVEVGTVTPRPQAGNPRPRVFRLRPDQGMINRLGFNNAGLPAAIANLRRLQTRPGPIGVNLGANRDSEDPIADYVTGLAAVSDLADYVTINISSPNTPGLRGLQDRDRLSELLSRVMAARVETTRAGALPVLVKLAPDLDDSALAEIAEILRESKVDGAIMGNTTVGYRAGLKSPHRDEAGGLSGRPLFEVSTDRLATLYRHLNGRIPLIGVGGVDSAETAYAKIHAGAALVQLYTGLVYEGPGLIGKIVTGLAELLQRDGFTSIRDAVGADVT